MLTKFIFLIIGWTLGGGDILEEASVENIPTKKNKEREKALHPLCDVI